MSKILLINGDWKAFGMLSSCIPTFLFVGRPEVSRPHTMLILLLCDIPVKILSSMKHLPIKSHNLPPPFYAFKGVVSHDQYFFWTLKKLPVGTFCTVYMRWWFLHFPVSYLMKHKTQSFPLLLCIYLLILKIFPVTHFKDLTAAILALAMHTGREPPVIL